MKHSLKVLEGLLAVHHTVNRVTRYGITIQKKAEKRPIGTEKTTQTDGVRSIEFINLSDGRNKKLALTEL